MSEDEAKNAETASEEGGAGVGESAKKGSVRVINAVEEKLRDQGDSGDSKDGGADGADGADDDK